MKAFLRTCADIELAIEQVYQLFIEKTADNSELCDLWRKLARDEYSHAQQLLLAERMLRPEMVNGGPQLPIEKAEKMLAQVKGFYAKAKGHPLSDLDCLKASIRLEKDFMAIHLDNALQLTTPGLQQMFSALARDDEDHFDILRAYLRRHEELFDL